MTECPGFTCGDRCEPFSCGPGDDHDQECLDCWTPWEQARRRPEAAEVCCYDGLRPCEYPQCLRADQTQEGDR